MTLGKKGEGKPSEDQRQEGKEIGIHGGFERTSSICKKGAYRRKSGIAPRVTVRKWSYFLQQKGKSDRFATSEGPEVAIVVPGRRNVITSREPVQMKREKPNALKGSL